MSTDISPAYRLKTRSYATIDRLVRELRAELKEKAIGIAVQSLAKRAVRVFDEVTLGIAKYPEGKSPACRAWEEFSREVKDTATKHERNPDSDMSFDMALMLHGGRFYAILYTEQKAFVDAFEQKFQAEDYSYWNGSDDQLKYLTKHQWDARERTWNKILSNTSAPSMNGASFQIVRPTRWLPDGMYKRIHEQAPSYESRLKHFALREAIDRLVEKRGVVPTAEDSLHEGIRIYNNALWDMQDGLEEQNAEMVQIYQEAEQHVASLLVLDPGVMIYEESTPVPPLAP